MANRAYLFCSDANPSDPTTWKELNRNEQHYYDSRHGIPLAWFFFFQPDDPKLVNISYSHTCWQEPKFMADKTRAIAYFNAHEMVLAEIVGARFYSAARERFLPALTGMPGSCLCVDHSEVVEDDESYLLFCRIAELITDKGTPITVLQDALRRFCFLTYKDEYEVALHVFGATYW